MNYFCNPINVPYPYQFKRDPRDSYRLTVNREAADPSLVLFRGRYYLFASMTGAVWVSDDLAAWESFPLPENLPIYDYAPDVCVVGDWLYFTASNRGTPCSFYRTKDPVNGPYEEIKGSFDYWDPHLFRDEDGRLYFYWGCANSTPIWGVELDPESMRPLSEKVPLIWGNPYEHGYERFGENNSQNLRTEEEIDKLFREFLDSCGKTAEQMPEENLTMIRATFAGMPYIEGTWMTKREGRYYLQYACPGSELNVYADSVYVSEHPLGPFRPAESNPYSCKPGGFLPGAGHGSTLQDKAGSWWHAATMRISVNHVFERRVGLWPAGFDGDDELFCNQRYGDWPMAVERLRDDPWYDPEWYLLSYGKVAASSPHAAGHGPELASDENVQTWWRAASAAPRAWLSVDLGEAMTVHAVQVNFADDPEADLPCPGELVEGPDMGRYIDREIRPTRWLLETSADGAAWEVLADKREALTDLSHDLVVREDGVVARYVRLTVYAVSYGAAPCVSGLRVFGRGSGSRPGRAEATAVRSGPLDFTVSAGDRPDVTGYTVLWGSSPDKLYHSRMVMGRRIDRVRIGALVKGRDYFVRVDAFNENGITEGEVMRL